MAKKRKAGGRSSGHEEPADVTQEKALLRINTYKDVADSEDEFFENQDKILLAEGPAQKRQRKAQEDSMKNNSLGCVNMPKTKLLTIVEFLELSDEEILIETTDDNEDGDASESAEELEDKAEIYQKKKKSDSRSIPFHDSDSEARSGPGDEEDTGGWGTNKKDYYNADVIETEADALEEEAEARRLQQKQLQGLTEEDFGFDEVEWLEANKPGAEDVGGPNQEKSTLEILPTIEVTEALGAEERLKLMRTRYPEFEPLTKEFLELQELHEDLKLAAEAAMLVHHRLRAKDIAVELESNEERTPTAVVKHRALSTYLAALCMYIAIFTSGKADKSGKLSALSPAELRDHAIMETLVQCRDLWAKVKDIAIPEKEPLKNNILNKNISSQGEMKNPEKNKTINITADPPTNAMAKKPRRSKAQRAAARAAAAEEALRLERVQKTEKDLLALSALIPKSKTLKSPLKPPTKPRESSPAASSDFGEQAALTPLEAEEKAKRKKTLRFYTSQIAQKSQKRDTAGRDAGGDIDLPHRERLRDRQARLNAEAESRGEKKESKKTKRMKEDPSIALGGESDEEDRRVAEELRDGPGGEEDYYQIVSAQHAAKKAAKQEAAAALAALLQTRTSGGEEAEVVGPDGKRAIGYTIQKNKGLAPKRKKDVRNPRVKKRKKYEEKKKKLSSIRKVYAGGEGKGGYGGEKSGIKKGLIRSVKL